MTLRLPALLAALAAAVSLAACGAKADVTETSVRPQRLELLLDYLPNADHAGLYAAQAAGDFEDAGLDVRLRTPADAASPLKLLAAGKVDLAISYEPEVLLARDKGADVVAIAAIAQKPLTSIMAIGKAKVRTVADLEGKTVGTAGIPYQSAYLKTILEDAGVNPEKVKEVNVGFNLVPAMLSGKADATLGAFWNVEGVQLQREKKEPVILRMDELGVPTYNELVLVARGRDLSERGEIFRRFLTAAGKGHKAVRDEPKVGVDALLAADADLDRPFTEATLEATLPVFFPESKREPFGFMNPTQWEAYGDWMVENGLLKQPPKPTSLTNEFLPGQGV